jgi:hypothetical protein
MEDGSRNKNQAGVGSGGKTPKKNLKTTRKNKTTTKREKNKILKTKSIQREEKSRHQQKQQQQQQQQGNGRHHKEHALTPVSTKDKSTTVSVILQRKRVSREAPMNLNQQKPPTDSRPRCAAALAEEEQEKQSARRERACLRDAGSEGTEEEKS